MASSEVTDEVIELANQLFHSLEYQKAVVERLESLLPEQYWSIDGVKVYKAVQRNIPGPRERVVSLLKMAPRQRLDYRSLARLVYPECLFPKSWKNASHGGPPGCYMSFSAMLRRMEDVEVWSSGRFTSDVVLLGRRS